MAVTEAARVPRRSGVLAWALWTLGVVAVAWLGRLVRQAGRPDLALWTADAGGETLAMVSAATVGAVLAGRRPRHPVGWLLLAFGLSLIAAGVARGYAGYGLLARPGSLPAADLVAAYDQHAGIPTAACLGFVLLLTPPGRRRRRAGGGPGRRPPPAWCSWWRASRPSAPACANRSTSTR